MDARTFLRNCAEGNLNLVSPRVKPINYNQRQWVKEITPEIISLFPGIVSHEKSLAACSVFWSWYFQQTKSISLKFLRSNICVILASLKIGETPVLSGPNKKLWKGMAQASKIKLKTFSGKYTPIKGLEPWDSEDARRAIDFLKILIECSGKNPGDGVEHLNMLLRITSFWILVLFRLMRKSQQHVANYLHCSINSKASLLMRKVLCIPPPPERTVLEFKGAFKKEERTTKAVLTVLIYSFVKQEDTKIRGFLNQGCIRHLNFVGLGLITWLDTAARALGVAKSELLTYFSKGLTKQSYEKIISLEAEVSTLGGMWSFSRLFKDEYLFQYSIPNNIRFCMACAFIGSEKTNGNNPMDLPEFAKFPQLEETSKQFAKNISSSLRTLRS